MWSSACAHFKGQADNSPHGQSALGHFLELEIFLEILELVANDYSRARGQKSKNLTSQKNSREYPIRGIFMRKPDFEVTFAF